MDKLRELFSRMTPDFQKGKQFEESVSNMIDYINYCTEEKDRYKKQLDEYSKDEELQMKDAKIKYIREHSLLQLSDKELEDEKSFREKHYHKCKNGNHYIYDIVGTGIGTCIKIKCPVCNKELDITDSASW